MKHIVLFGATGNVGRYLTDHLVKSFPEMQVVAVGRHEPDWMKNTGASFVKADVTQPESFAALPQQDVFAVLNFAGVLPAYLSGSDTSVYIRVNTEGALHVLEYARKTGAERVVYSQSVSRYHGYLADDIRVFKPDMPAKFNYTNDHAVYIIAKTAAVELMEHYHQTYGIRTFEIVLPNIYLYDPAEYYYVDGVARPIAYRYMIRRAMAGEPLELWGDPNKGIDLVYVKDLCRLVECTLRCDQQSGRYNAGSGKLTTMEEYLRGIIRVFSPADKPSELVYRPEKPDCANFMMDITNCREDLGYEPQYDCLAFLEDYKREMEKDQKK